MKDGVDTVRIGEGRKRNCFTIKGGTGQQGSDSSLAGLLFFTV